MHMVLANSFSGPRARSTVGVGRWNLTEIFDSASRSDALTSCLAIALASVKDWLIVYETNRIFKWCLGCLSL